MKEIESSPYRRELEDVETSPMRVYPMGFTPDIKHRLLDSAEARRLKETSRLTAIGQQLREAVDRFESGTMELSAFLDQVRLLDELVKEGEASFEEEREFLTHSLRTDEEIAVIFAKISRNPGSFEEIARSVTEEGAAQFHQKWTVSVEGYGHASVAEHAIIHLAVENVPSLDGDFLTDNRLASFTEFSARFKGRQGVGYFTPEAVKKDSTLLKEWHDVHQFLFETHDNLMAKGLAYLATDEARQRWPARKVIPKTVADQFKDLMPASRLTSIGVTFNAREAENVIRKMLSAPYPSVQKLGSAIKEQSLAVSPTLVKYAERNEYLVVAREGLNRFLAKRQLVEEEALSVDSQQPKVDLVEVDTAADNKFVAAALYAQTPAAVDFRSLLKLVGQLSEADKREILDNLLGKMGRWDVPVRALEMPGDYLVEFRGMTYGIWREYKRHRMQSYQVKAPNIDAGYMIPPLAYELDQSKDSQFHGSVESVKQAMGKVETLFEKVAQIDPFAAHYAVTRLHYRPALAKFNLREAYHLIDLRTSNTAHPFIRGLTWSLLEEISKVQPVLMDYLRFKMAKANRPDPAYPWTS